MQRRCQPGLQAAQGSTGTEGLSSKTLMWVWANSSSSGAGDPTLRASAAMPASPTAWQLAFHSDLGREKAHGTWKPHTFTIRLGKCYTITPAIFCWLEVNQYDLHTMRAGITPECEYQEADPTGSHQRAHLPQSPSYEQLAFLPNEDQHPPLLGC